jgi:hypothetical protein
LIHTSIELVSSDVLIVEPDQEECTLNENAQKEDEKCTESDEKRLFSWMGELAQPLVDEENVEAQQ